MLPRASNGRTRCLWQENRLFSTILPFLPCISPPCYYTVYSRTLTRQSDAFLLAELARYWYEMLYEDDYGEIRSGMAGNEFRRSPDKARTYGWKINYYHLHPAAGAKGSVMIFTRMFSIRRSWGKISDITIMVSFVFPVNTLLSGRSHTQNESSLPVRYFVCLEKSLNILSRYIYMHWNIREKKLHPCQFFKYVHGFTHAIRLLTARVA